MAQNHRSIRQIPGIYAGQSTDDGAGTGCTVIVCPAGATGGIDVRGGAYAHAIRPVHTTNDGDTVFVMATGEVETMVDAVGALAVRALERAIADAARSAASAYGLKAACDLEVAAPGVRGGRE